MCGIAGIISTNPEDHAHHDLMSAAIAHRGPDSDGMWQDDGVTLVHRRLSVIDVEHGQQPMLSEDGKLIVIFNGEIYNYPQLRSRLEADGTVFRTHCDTEVLLHLYRKHGSDMVKHLRGMFAFAIWNRDRQVLTLARDHLGQKPLFYWSNGSTFVFASEMKAIFASGLVTPEVSLEGLWHHTGLKFCPGDGTLFNRIRKVKPAHTLVVKPASQEISDDRFWQLDYRQKKSLSFNSAVDELYDLLDDTVHQHLLSDVQLGCFLSGGVDSSTVTAFASRHTEEPLRTFSIGVEDGDFSELPFARRAAEILDTHHTEFKVSADLMLLLPDIIWHMEEPGDPHAVGLFLLSRLARRHVKVAIGGDGGDECFGGYTRFSCSPLLSAYNAIPQVVRQHIISPMFRHIPESFSYYSLASKARWAHELSMLTGADRHYHAMSFFRFPEQQRRQLFAEVAQSGISDSDTVRWIAEHFNSPLINDEVDRRLYAEQMTRMPEHYLLIADRMSMAHGLELRAPLVDYRLSEFSASLPCSYKIRSNQLKIILRSVAKRFFPTELIDRRKLGFGFPIARWFKGPLAGFIKNVMDDSRILDTGWFHRDYVDALLHEHQTGRIDHNFRIWNILNLEVWYRLFICGDSRETVHAWLGENLGQKSTVEACVKG